MSDRMRPIPFRELLLRSAAEYRAKGSIFDIPDAHFWKPASQKRARIFNSEAANLIGPAAGPHTQLAQNILCSWLCGGRAIELKTVQKMDTLTVEKPCIDAADEGYNVEWSQELTLEQSYDEYLKAWFLLHAFETLMGQTSQGSTSTIRPGFLFTMSVGYDLAGIRTDRMDQFIRRLIDSSGEPLFQRYGEELESLAAKPDLFEGTPWRGRAPQLRGLAQRISPRLSSSVTLSTMHGCPPQEIESICAYMLNEKKLDTLVKLNPTLLGYDRARALLQETGFVAVGLNPEGFKKDLQYGSAVDLLGRLLTLARATSRHFGAKLSNTLAAANNRNFLPGAEMYMSGRALYPLTMRLAADLSTEFQGALPLSFSGGASAWNLADILSAGLRPVTLATDLLKPGGYARLNELADIAVRFTADSWRPMVDVKRVARAAEAAKNAAPFHKDFRGERKIAVPGALPLFDCFVAPCVQACPIHQDVPEYVHLAGAGKWREAFEVVHARNPLPFITGYLCDHQCTENCTRRDWEGAVRIRDVKRIAAEKGYALFRSSVTTRTASRGVRVGSLDSGPGMAAASFLRREGFDVHVFERESESGGVVRWLLPPFAFRRIRGKGHPAPARSGRSAPFRRRRRIGRESSGQGIRVHTGGHRRRGGQGRPHPEARAALSFLREYRRNPSRVRLGRAVAVIGPVTRPWTRRARL